MIRPLLLTLLLGLSTPLSAAPPISIYVHSTIGTAPLYLNVRINLTPDSRNRWVCLYAQQIEQGSEAITSCWDVEGEREAKTTWRMLKRLSAGRWDIRAAVIRNDDQASISNYYEVVVN